MDRNSSIVAAVPKRLYFYWLFFLTGSVMTALLEYAYFQLPLITQTLPGVRFTLLDIAERECLLNWLISLFLLSAAVVAQGNVQLGIYFHDTAWKNNAWFWAALASLFLSADVHSALRFTLQDLLSAAAGTSLYQDGTVWWLGLYLFFLGLIGLRLLIAMLTTFFPLLFLLAAAACQISGQLTDFGLLTLPSVKGERELLILRTGLTAASALFFLLSAALFARRQVFRDPEIALRWTAQVWNHSRLLQMLEEQKQKEMQQNTPVVPAKLPDKTAQRPVIKPNTEKALPPKPDSASAGELGIMK